ncbi:MAG: S41 family peptidase [Alistipes sp.]|nr:S41 family peptidase [Alistipes sp.]
MSINIRALGIVALATLLCVSGASAQSTERQQRDLELSQSMEIVTNIMRELESGYVDDINAPELLEAAAAGLILVTDPYSDYYSEKEMSDFEMMTTGRYAGVGSLIRKQGDYVLFAQPYKGSPSDEAGIEIGDKILSIGGEDMRGRPVGDISSLLRGEPGTAVDVVVERNYDKSIDTIHLTRRRISIPSVGYAGFVRDGIAYIQHNDFIDGSYNEIRSALERIMATDSLRGIILDYRSNGGGVMQEAVNIASLFLPRGERIVSIMGRDSSSLRHFATEHEPLAPDVPIVVLVNGSSASASEILAGALQDTDRAVIMGQRTYGKGLVQGTRHVGYNSYLKYTTAKYYIPSGRCIQSRNYSSLKSGGEVTIVPDSLITEFRTAGGRKVYDGGGIVPDVKVDVEYVSRFALTLYSMGYMEDWADEYMRRHHDEEIDIRTFSLTDEDYADFCRFIEERDVPYESETRRALTELEKAVKNDRYNASLDKAVEALKKLVKDDKMSNMQNYREQIMEALTAAIVLRHAYSEGVVEYTMVHDDLIDQAVELLLNSEEYNRILREQDLEMH